MIRTVHNFGILYLRVHWAYIINFLMINLLNMSFMIRTVHNFGILYLRVHWAYIINFLMILVCPNCLGHVIGHDNIWA